MDSSESLLKAILSTVARSAFPPNELLRIVAPISGSQKQVQAYNSCDGRTPQAQIAKRLGLDKGNLSRSISRWLEAGIVVRIGADDLPLHVYPITEDVLKQAKAKG